MDVSTFASLITCAPNSIAKSMVRLGLQPSAELVDRVRSLYYEFTKERCAPQSEQNLAETLERVASRVGLKDVVWIAVQIYEQHIEDTRHCEEATEDEIELYLSNDSYGAKY